MKANLNKTKLQKFLQTCIGSNYWMVHGMEGGKVYFWEMSDSKNSQFSNISGNVEIQYGGKQGRGKRIDIVFSNQYFDFKMNIAQFKFIILRRPQKYDEILKLFLTLLWNH